MNHFALDLLHTCGRLAARLLQAHSLGSHSFWHLLWIPKVSSSDLNYLLWIPKALTLDPQSLFVGSDSLLDYVNIL